MYKFWKLVINKFKKKVSKLIEVDIRFNQIESALNQMRQKMQREGRYSFFKRGKFHEKNSQKRLRKRKEALARRAKIRRMGYSV